MTGSITSLSTSVKAWMYYIRATVGEYVDVETQRRAKAAKVSVAAMAKIVKAELFAYKKTKGYEKTVPGRKFFCKAKKLWIIKQRYSMSIIFNGNIPFGCLGRTTKHEEQIFECAETTGCAALFRAVQMPQDDLVGKAIIERFLN